MKHAITALLITLFTTACETHKSGAEISALGESLMSTAPATSDAVPANQPAIDYHARAALNFADATAACRVEARNLCTKDQLMAAYQTGKVGNPPLTTVRYWMVKTTVSPSRNLMVIGPGYPPSFNLEDIELTHNFYCCL